jgi:hypothetical protein
MSPLDRVSIHVDLYGTRRTMAAAVAVGGYAGALAALTVHLTIWIMTTLGG